MSLRILTLLCLFTGSAAFLGGLPPAGWARASRTTTSLRSLRPFMVATPPEKIIDTKPMTPPAQTTGAITPCSVTEDECLDGKLYCRPSAAKKIRPEGGRDASEIIHDVFSKVVARDPDQPEYHQAVWEVLESLEPVIAANPHYADNSILERLVEPERTLSFRVPWTDDNGVVQVNRGYRVQFSSSIGPYKGGLRFHPSVNLSILKFLGFEQVFKNSLTGLPLGGGKGGADFDPKGKSDKEVMRFCQSFMAELHRHIGADVDVPAGDIGVGGREIGYLYGMYKKLRNEFTGVLTGKDMQYGGSLIRPEATGYGLVYFAREMLATRGKTLQGARVALSGSGNVAQYACEKVLDLGGVPVTMSDSSGWIYDEEGISRDKLAYIRDLKNHHRGRLATYAEDHPGVVYTPTPRGEDAATVWSVAVDVALPCATQNELTGEDAAALVAGGVVAVAEGANMPCTPEAVSTLQRAGVLFAPAKASNAGGVGTSGLEMSQNSLRMSWTREKVDGYLEAIMVNIHTTTARYAQAYGREGDYVFGANVAAFFKVADAMEAQGIV
eukprot:CAMPEP_0181334088 /NCGR_PEP_ID=MMETSP1101-20121128/26056_1 /TAXON_ID=46948 /ORGANISM="Rhodomonas abbreviata, Strain Caron Lab Isolate" /LENGTH=553 /DNA_ID=CAMNT_0023444007 /DNA_START=99 /DNA_END=1760 /DNA_ORIENTATION=+